jgi:hypothetical protein
MHQHTNFMVDLSKKLKSKVRDMEKKIKNKIKEE